MDSLEQFLKTGRLGVLAPGATTEEVRQVLGAPADVSVKTNPQTWKYGPLQLAFSRTKDSPASRLVFVGLYFQDSWNHLPPSLGWQGWIPPADWSREDLRAFLQDREITASEPTERQHVVLPSGVRIVLDDEKVSSIQFAAPGRGERRQVSLSLPEEIWRSLQAEAARRKVAPGDLCAQWIASSLSGGVAKG